MLYPEGWYFKLIGYYLQAWGSATSLKSCSSFCFWQEGVKRPYLPSLWNKNYQTKYKKLQLSRHWCQAMKKSKSLRNRKQIWLCLKMKVKSLSHFRLFATPWTEPTTLHPWDFPAKSTRVGCHFLLQRIFSTQGSNLGLPHCRQALYHLSHQGSYAYAYR